MLLDWLGTRHDDARLPDAAVRVEDGVARGGPRRASAPGDLGGQASTDEFTDAVVERIAGT